MNNIDFVIVGLDYQIELIFLDWKREIIKKNKWRWVL